MEGGEEAMPCFRSEICALADEERVKGEAMPQICDLGVDGASEAHALGVTERAGHML